MNKDYRPAEIESRHYARWEAAKYFVPAGDGMPYCIVIPPPNVTGTLHMGHALQDTIMDALTRYQRMRGRRTLWLPGTDHAGIATQMVVERLLEREGTFADSARAGKVSRARLAMEGAFRQHDRATDAPLGRLGRLVARAIHDGPRPLERGARGVRSSP